jgi:catecholate siderophore receptor
MPATAANPAGLPGGLVWRRTNTRYGVTEALTNQTDLFGTFETGAIKHSFAVGAEISWEKARRGTFAVNSGGAAGRCSVLGQQRFNCTSLFNPNPSDPWVNYASDDAAAPRAAIGRNVRSAETQNDAHTVAAYAFDTITLLPELMLNLGGRFDHFESKVTPGLAVGATSTFSLSREDDLFNWQAGLIFKPTPNTSLYASYATAATPPNSLIGEGQESNSLGTANTPQALALLDSLKIEKTKSYEVGAKANLFDEQLSLSLAAFQTETENTRVTGPNNNIEFIGKRRIRGVEFNFNGNVTRWLTVFGGYTHLDPKIVDGGYTALIAPIVPGQTAKTVLVPSVNTGRQAPQTARDSFTLWADVKPTSRFSVGGGAFYTSRVFGGYQDNRAATQDTAGVVTVASSKVLVRTIPEYWRFDARLGYKLTDQVELSVNVNNITDKTYFTQAYTSHYAAIAPGRSAFATIGLKF